jgi:hypothetical protein
MQAASIRPSASHTEPILSVAYGSGKSRREISRSTQPRE